MVDSPKRFCIQRSLSVPVGRFRLSGIKKQDMFSEEDQNHILPVVIEPGRVNGSRERETENGQERKVGVRISESLIRA